jgi:lipopolysaccharide transport system permease protein
MSILFFATPVFYKPSLLSPWAQRIVWMNPMTYIVTFYRNIFLDHSCPRLVPFFYLILFSVLFFFIGYRFFKAQENRIVELV